MKVVHRRLLELALDLQAGDELDQEAARWIQAQVEQDRKKQRKPGRWRKARLVGHGKAGEFYLEGDKWALD